jgi:hypothetical protein
LNRIRRNPYPSAVLRPIHGAALAALLLLACGGGDGSGSAGSGPETADASPDVPAPDAVAPADAAVADAAPVADAAAPCADDRDCPDMTWCADDGRCRPAAGAPFVAVPHDGVTRAAAAAFDITPAYLERWFDHAGPGCPDNEPGRFDGRLDAPSPPDPCADGFDDADGDGFFDGVWLGGGDRDRPALGVDNGNPPAGRVLVLTRDDRLWVLVTLDVHAVDLGRVRELSRYLRLRLGIPDTALSVHATGDRNGPDAVGLWGPSLDAAGGPQAEALRQRGWRALSLLGSIPFTPGGTEAWWEDIRRRCAAAVTQAGQRLQPVTVRAATVDLPLETPADSAGGAIELPDADADGVRNDARDLAAYRSRPWRLSRDLRLPEQRDRTLRAAALDQAADGRPVAVLLGWGAAPATRPAAQPYLSADFPGEARQWLEAANPGAVALWLGSAADDTVVADEGVFVPTVDPMGTMLDAAGQPVDDIAAAAPAPDPTAALGTLLAARGQAALQAAERAPADLQLTGRYAWVPLTNPRYGLAARLGILRQLGDWLSGRVATSSWSSGVATPACGGLGCLRFRLDRVDLGPLTLITTPGALDDAYVQGRSQGGVAFGDERNLVDLDADGVPDDVDPEIRVAAHGPDRDVAVTLPGPLNPQRFEAIEALARPRVWLVGRTNGGIGGMHPRAEDVDVFEGQLDGLVTYVQGPDAALDLCQAGYPCTGPLTLRDLTQATLAAQPAVLADIPGAHELWLMGADFGAGGHPMDGGWSVRAPDGTPRAGGGHLEIGPGDRVFSLGTDFRSAGVQSGDVLEIQLDDDTVQSYVVGGIDPVELAAHPNRGDAWTALAGGGGDFVYNTACELLHGGACPSRRPIDDDPNQVLQRTP